jgi:phosphoribosylaminoimidazole (AIR) synthetase
VLPKDCAVEIDLRSWPPQPIFELLRRLGNLEENDFRRTFNLGVGMVFIVPARKIGFVRQTLQSLREPFYEIGQVVPAKPRRPKVIYL